MPIRKNSGFTAAYKARVMHELQYSRLTFLDVVSGKCTMDEFRESYREFTQERERLFNLMIEAKEAESES